MDMGTAGFGDLAGVSRFMGVRFVQISAGDASAFQLRALVADWLGRGRLREAFRHL